MICPNCGFNSEIGSFCPKCGKQLPTEMPEPDNKAQNMIDEIFEPENKKKSKKSEKAGKSGKKSKKKLIIIIVSVILVIAIAAFVIFGIILNNKKDPFAVQAKKVKKDSDAYDTLMILSALDNTILNSKSFNFSFIADNENEMELKVCWGKDLASSDIYFEAETRPLLCLNDGDAIVSDGWDSGASVDAAEILKDPSDVISALVKLEESSIDRSIAHCEEEIEYLKEEKDDYINNDYDDDDYYDDDYYDDDYYDEGYCEQMISIYEEEIASLKKSKEFFKDLDSSAEKPLTSIVKKEKLDADSLNSICQYFLSYLRVDEFDGTFDIETAKTLTDVLDCAAKFVSEKITEDEISVEKTKKGGKEFEYKFEIELGDFFEALSDYLDDNSDFLEDVFGEEIAKELIEEARDAADYLDGETIEGKATVNDKYLTKLSVEIDGDDFTVKFTDINNTEIGEKDYNRVKKQCQNIKKFNSSDDVVDFIKERY